MNELEALKVKGDLPRHFQEFYPKFITLMKDYIDWLHKSGLTKEEIQSLLDNDDWIQDDIEEFMKNGNSKYLNFDDEDYKQSSIIEQSRKRLCCSANDLLKNTAMERSFENISTRDGEWFVCKPDNVFRTDEARPYMVTSQVEEIIKQHYKKFNFPWTKNSFIHTFGNKLTATGQFVIDDDGKFVLVNTNGTEEFRMRTLDHPRMIKLLKFVHGIKGTKKAIELFFDIFTGIPINNVIYPKQQLMVIDGVNDTEKNHIDGTSKIRDDLRYSEFSYIIELSGTSTLYEFVFEEIYKKYFHPTGFYVAVNRV